MTIWPIKPYPEDKLPLELLRVAYKDKLGAVDFDSHDRIFTLCRKLVLQGIEVPDDLISAAIYARGKAIPRADYRIYDPNDPVSLLEIFLKFWHEEDRTYVDDNVDYDIVRLKIVQVYPIEKMFINIPKVLLIAALEKSVEDTLKLFYPSVKLFYDVLFTYHYQNIKLVSFLIEESVKIDPLEAFFAISQHKIYARTVANSLSAIKSYVNTFSKDPDAIMQKIEQAVKDKFGQDLN